LVSSNFQPKANAATPITQGFYKWKDSEPFEEEIKSHLEESGSSKVEDVEPKIKLVLQFWLLPLIAFGH
jgi:hypothetical protein